MAAKPLEIHPAAGAPFLARSLREKWGQRHGLASGNDGTHRQPLLQFPSPSFPNPEPATFARHFCIDLTTPPKLGSTQASAGREGIGR